MTRSGAQLALGLEHMAALSRADFVVGACNRDALAAIEAWPDWPEEPVLLAGAEGSGKTHLVRVWVDLSGATVLPASRLDGEEAVDFSRPLAVEDIDKSNETALFHLLNRCRERGTPLLLTARDAAVAARVSLPDLASRLRAARPIRLLPPDDAFLHKVLVKLFADRQLFVSAPLLEYLVRRMERSFAAAAALVRGMDEAALAGRKPLSRQLAAEVLAALASGGDGAPEGPEAK